MNVRSVEQRGFLTLGLLPIGLVFLIQKRLMVAFACFILALVAVHVGISTNSRIGWAILAIDFFPLLFWLRSQWSLWLAVATLAISIVGAAFQGWMCDERLWLMKKFIGEMPSNLWGGRQISFTYQSCPPIAPLHFGSFEGSDAHLVHNVFLDVYNDTGLLPMLVLLLGTLPLAWMLGGGLMSTAQRQGLSNCLILRWSVVSVILVEWMVQPFLYSDQLMFTLSFLLAGFLLAEFDQPKGQLASSRLEVQQTSSAKTLIRP